MPHQPQVGLLNPQRLSACSLPGVDPAVAFGSKAGKLKAFPSVPLAASVTAAFCPAHAPSLGPCLPVHLVVPPPLALHP